MKRSLLTKLQQVIQPEVTAMGYELWGIEVHQAGVHTLVRVYIDSNTGVGIDDCSKVSTRVSALLDVANVIEHQFNLEVSSPGLDRTLFTIEQYQKFIGAKVKVALLGPYNGRRNYIGDLQTVDGDKIALVTDGHELLIPFANISKTSLMPTF